VLGSGLTLRCTGNSAVLRVFRAFQENGATAIPSCSHSSDDPKEVICFQPLGPDSVYLHDIIFQCDAASENDLGASIESTGMAGACLSSLETFSYRLWLERLCDTAGNDWRDDADCLPSYSTWDGEPACGSIGLCGIFAPCNAVAIDRSMVQRGTCAFPTEESPFDQLYGGCDAGGCVTNPNGGGGNGGGGGGCFSASSTVEIEGKGVVRMEDIKVGDRVRVVGSATTATGQTKSIYETIYSFGHRQVDAKAQFLQIHTTTTDDSQLIHQQTLEITPEHLVFVADLEDKSKVAGRVKPVRADSLQVGDRLVLAATDDETPGSDAAVVTKISTVEKVGLYMPLTSSGTIVVSGILASTYVSLQDEVPSVVSTSALFLSEQNLLHWWLVGYRIISRMTFLPAICHTTDGKNHCYNDEGIHYWLLLGRRLAAFAERQSFFVQIVFLGIPLLAVFGILLLVESFVFAGNAAIFTLFLLFWGVTRHKKTKNE
jgi:hypothetical protein